MFILIHGAYHGGWCWGPLIECLQARGINAVAPDLPGHALTDGWIGDQEMSSYIKSVVTLIDDMDSAPVLVGHSMSGAVVAAAAEQRPDIVAKLIFLAAYIPADGECVGDLVKTDPASFVKADKIEISGVTAISPKAGVLADAFYNDATPSQMGWVEDRIQLQAARTFRTPLSLSRKNFGSVPKVAIVCTKDRAISVEHERWMAIRAGCDPIIDFDSGHSPFVTAPDKLSDVLISL